VGANHPTAFIAPPGGGRNPDCGNPDCGEAGDCQAPPEIDRTWFGPLRLVASLGFRVAPARFDLGHFDLGRLQLKRICCTFCPGNRANMYNR